jgi:hypothetical protein
MFRTVYIAYLGELFDTEAANKNAESGEGRFPTNYNHYLSGAPVKEGEQPMYDNIPSFTSGDFGVDRCKT